MCHGMRIAYLPKFDLLPAAMKAVKPTVFLGVPRVYEKIRQGVEAKSAGSGVKKGILNFALKVGKKNREATMRGGGAFGGGVGGWRISWFTRRFGEAFGGCVGTFVSGGAPLGMDTAGWFLRMRGSGSWRGMG